MKSRELKRLRDKTDPFALAKRLDEKLERIYGMANLRVSPQTAEPKVQSPTPNEKQTMEEIAKIFAS